MPHVRGDAMTLALIDQAAQALALAPSEPGRAAGLGAQVIAQARTARDHAAWSVAARARGLAAMHNGDLDSAIAHLRESIARAMRSGAPRLAAQARMTLAFAQSSRGRTRVGLREIDTALTDLDGVDRARAQAQRAVILHQLGRLDEALTTYAGALPALRAAEDGIWVWRVLSNRGVLYGQRLELAAARADLDEAASLCDRLDLGAPTGYVRQNLGWIATLAGDVPAALHHFDDAERRLRALDARLGEVLRDRAELLLSVYLAAEARESAAAAIDELERERRLIVLPEARLLLARAATMEGDPGTALEQARRAEAEFRRQGRPDWRAVARLAVLTSLLAAGERSRVTVRDVARVADALDAARWPAPAVDARLLAGTVAYERGRTPDACRHWEQAGRSRHRGPATVRARAWYGTALARDARGDAAGALDAVRAGLRIVDEYRATMGATDLLARTAGHRTDLSRLGLRLAFDSRRAGRVLAWAERGRASQLRAGPVRPPEDETLRGMLAELRATASEVDRLRHEGLGTARALARQTALEHRVRDHFRRRRGYADRARPVSVADLAGRLGGAALVEFVEHDGRLHAVTVTGRGLRMRELAAVAEVDDLLDRIPFALRRMGRSRSTPDSGAAALAMLRDAAARLDAALLRPLARQLGDAPLILVPTGRLQSVPWSVVPSCAGRPVVVAPSATAWYRAAGPPEPTTVPEPVGTTGPAAGPPGPAELAEAAGGAPVAVVAGPELRGARAEAVGVAEVHRVVPVLGDAATVDATLRALDRADLAHLAAHGRLSAENPLFSCLSMVDGPLMVYDVEALGRVPPTVILSACDSGRNHVVAGDELLGLAATFLGRGTRRLVGSVIPIPDAQTAPFMVEFHRILATGRTVAGALAQAQQAAIEHGGAILAAAAGFVCVGADAGVRAG